MSQKQECLEGQVAENAVSDLTTAAVAEIGLCGFTIEELQRMYDANPEIYETYIRGPEVEC